MRDVAIKHRGSMWVNVLLVDSQSMLLDLIDISSINSPWKPLIVDFIDHLFNRLINLHR